MSAWVTERAPTQTELATCVQCGLCLPHCPTFRLTGLETASPRGRIAAMRAVADGVIALDAEFEEVMTFCLNCRACEAVCPSFVPFGRVMEGARAELTAQRPSSQRRLRHFLLGRVLPQTALVRLATFFAVYAQRTGLVGWLKGGVGRSARGLRPLSRRLPRRPTIAVPSVVRGTVGLLTGCVMQSWFAGVNQAAVDLLTRAGYQVVVPDQQTCCGALAVHDGDVVDGDRLARRNMAAFAKVDRVVATAAGCSAHLKDYRHLGEEGADLSSRAADITQIVSEAIEAGHLPLIDRASGKVVVHDPCHLRHAQGVTAAPRRILAAAGYQVVEIDPDGICCGAAGVYSLMRPEAAHQLGMDKANQIVTTGVRLVASANPGCDMQIRSHLDRGYRVVHPIELYAEALGAEGA
ncbi:MAG: (Fe-S)-binding protein [Actinomycetota bacterium]